VQGEEAPPPGEVDPKHPIVPNALWAIVGRVKQRIVDSFTPAARSVFEREFRLFDGITAISGKIKPLPKEQRRAAIKP
jgi:phosphatidylinositol 4-kinase